jgi:NADH-quinone oxidoreductase subunit C
MTRLETLKSQLQAVLGGHLVSTAEEFGEITVVVAAGGYLESCGLLRDDPSLAFSECIDLCALDYSTYGDGTWEGGRFATVLHLLSIEHNWRLRVRVFCQEDDFPTLPSVVPVWPSAGWYEREAFDLFGVIYEGHGDLRRILTDYGFIGHPFRKDFPVSGHVEMRYDPEQKRVIYQPVSIEPREITPRIIREEKYAGMKK